MVFCGFRYGVVGPLVAESVEVATSIIGHISERYSQKIGIFVIEPHETGQNAEPRNEMVRVLGRLGFAEKVLPIMTWQGRSLPAYQAAANWSPLSLALG
jgi:hypothetical protein